MAKKVKKKLEEDDEYKAFHFPEFDVRGFIHHELEQTSANVVAFFLAIGMSVVSWYLTFYGMGIGLGSAFSAIAIIVGILGAVSLPFLIRWLREKSTEYRTGDWAAIIALYIFLWLGLWSLFLNV
jgi:hypothetical protein